AIYSTFLQRAYSHIIHDVAIEGLPVTFCLDRAGLVGEDGPTHHGVFDLAYLRSIPGMTIAVPRDGDELRRLMYTSLTLDGPMAIRYPRGRAAQHPSDTRETVTIGTGERLKDGGDLAVLTVGPVADDAMRAIRRAEDELGMSIALYDMRFVKPLDSALLTEIIGKKCPVITVEDGVVNGGMGSAVLEWISENLPEGYDHPKVTRLGVPDRFIPQGSPAQLHELCGFDEEGIYQAIAGYKKQSN
ncbi:MAG: 1-deoxy-D-xylulose-5-phosphate synthase, partial [Duncaniella sp.]|nr:1-deoxy-D-xylulose-5-phosphate synthase [Duncaniella sp.]